MGPMAPCQSNPVNVNIEKTHEPNKNMLWYIPINKVHVVLSAPGGPHVGPLNFTIRVLSIICLTTNIPFLQW